MAFQSTPGHKSRENLYPAQQLTRRHSFNPLPATKAGRTANAVQVMGRFRFQSTPGHKSRENNRRNYPGGDKRSFNPLPATKAGRTGQPASGLGRICFNPLPATKAGRSKTPALPAPVSPFQSTPGHKSREKNGKGLVMAMSFVSIHSRPQKPGEGLQGLPIRCRANRIQSTPGHKSRENCRAYLSGAVQTGFNPLPATKAGRSVLCHFIAFVQNVSIHSRPQKPGESG